MNTLAKRVHNVAPDPVLLTFADDSTVTLAIRSAEFFQEAFQAEGVDESDGAIYRLVTDGEDDPLLAARERCGDDVDGGGGDDSDAGSGDNGDGGSGDDGGGDDGDGEDGSGDGESGWTVVGEVVAVEPAD